MKLLIFLESTRTYQIFSLPTVIDGNYWVHILDENGQIKNILNVYALDGRWVYQENGQIIPLEVYRFYSISFKEKMLSIYTLPLYNSNLEIFFFKQMNQFCLGKKDSDILYEDYNGVLTFTKKNEKWIMQCDKPENAIYVNQKLTSGKLLETGDHLFVHGLNLYVLGSFFAIDNPNQKRKIISSTIQLVQVPMLKESLDDDLDVLSIYDKKDYFYRSPRFRNVINEVSVVIDAPPNSSIREEMPFLLQMGSMLTMGMSSMVTLFVSVSGIVSGEKTIQNTWPSLVIGVSMMVGMLCIPLFTKRYQKKQSLKNEKIRQEKYLEYLALKKKEIYQVIEDQQQAFNANSVSLEQCEDIILHHRRNLWERKIEHDDFLSAHIGIGEIPAKIKIQFPEEHFSLDNDNLKAEVQKMAKEPRTLKNVPINVSFVQKNICAILGNFELIPSFLNTILLQFIAFQSYEDVKFVIFTTKDSKEKWESFKKIPYLWNNEKTFRYYGETKEDIFSICTLLNEEFQNRAMNEDTKSTDKDYKNFLPYYVIITDNFEEIRDFDFIKNVLKSKVNYGFSFLIINERLMGLPNECNSFINVDANQSGMIENELSSDRQQVFQAEFLNKSLDPLFQEICNIPIEFTKSKGNMPESISFLELYNVGKVEQLNALNRWKTNHSYETLKAPVGVDQNGGLFFLDLHEKAHGPHGLIAGMTGSGKSEFIITYILSMALNYHPYDVSFVLIDYKGGGLAGAFENKDLGIKLPHLAGTITNLDTVEIGRSLASIESELKRRQKLFNEAREQTNESTINIYKYQKLYHQGIVKTPVPHLFIISDEFAELKSQQPEFMAQLISTARIGRSLGVHLILATQKPSGVVDAQIWSNSKFRVCLKVQDRSDSMDMIKVPDAAALSTVGRFYLQVGYNEFFAMGQSAWAGAPYYEMDERKTKIDSSIHFVDNVGKVIKSVEQENQKMKSSFKGEELPAILKYISDLAKKEQIHVDPLWLSSIPEFITIGTLEKKYSYKSIPFVLNEVIGEYDSPSTQSQHLLTLPISKDGNVLLYGASGSGKENFLTTFILSTILHHTPEEVQFYLLDFGAETLTMFQDAPHVGDVVFSSDNEKVTNLFKMINEMVQTRKSKFMNFGGTFESYNAKNDKKEANVIIVLNNYENFKELYENFEEDLISLTREATKYGIYFILSVLSSNSIRIKLFQNFKSIYSLQLNNEDEYTNILGNVHKTFPSKKFGRGITRIQGEIYEFQTAYVCEKEHIVDTVRDFCLKLKKYYSSYAKKIPVLPQKVTYSALSPIQYSLEDFVVGVEKDSLELSRCNFKSKTVSFVTALELDNLENFTYGLIDFFQPLSNHLLYVLDMGSSLDPRKVHSKYYYSKKVSDVYQSVCDYIDKLALDFANNQKDEQRLEKYTHLTLIIYGIEDFFKLIKENMEKFEKLLQNGHDLEKLNIILVDASYSIKKYEMDSWYRNFVMSNHGIWVGSGITEQFVLKLAKTPKYCYEEISNQYGYVVKNGVPVLVKLLEGDKSE